MGRRLGLGGLEASLEDEASAGSFGRGWMDSEIVYFKIRTHWDEDRMRLQEGKRVESGALVIHSGIRAGSGGNSR